ncbi:hypothetical protein RHSIM_Rhsim03G0166700 [Rhododendron simsii]|uniref:Uncharacterized protein n=1 Tax=Rhododendron simsii TaxID=118357 RepID=A0A834H965_RHOSS|nr:hypothetical protein RHSIM_Rhsim03G0166700 [Rhododendron simsii]
MTRNSRLVSSPSHNNFSSGFYSLFFDDDNLLRLAFDSPAISSVYWPDPVVISWDAGRTTSDYGTEAWRRLKMDVDGNVRLYSLDEEKRI